MLFDINDFDETLPGPWEWDVKRLAASFEVAGRDLGFAPADRRDIVAGRRREYRDAMRRRREMRASTPGTTTSTVDDLLAWIGGGGRGEAARQERGREAQRPTSPRHARATTSARFRRRAGEVDGKLRIAADPPLIVPIEDLVPAGHGARGDRGVDALADRPTATRSRAATTRIEEYHYVHTARKVVGVGSVGTRAWILLLRRARQRRRRCSCRPRRRRPRCSSPSSARASYGNHGQRVVVGQRLMQAASDIFLGWLRVEGLDGVSCATTTCASSTTGRAAPTSRASACPGATLYARLCGATLARAHARRGDRIAIASYLGNGDAFDRALADFAVAYADQNERDYEAFTAP